MPRRPSAQTVRLLAALASARDTWRHGYDLGREVGIGAGSLYPILFRLHERGYLESRWEAPAPQGRPARHEYRLTAAGAALAQTWTRERCERAPLRPLEA